MYQIISVDWSMMCKHVGANKAVEIERPHKQDFKTTNEQSIG